MIMNIDPQKFFIGLMDFFSILLPGALLQLLQARSPTADPYEFRPCASRRS
jgi:hypothetical protein